MSGSEKKRTRRTRLLVLLGAVILVSSSIYTYFALTHGVSLWRTLEVTLGFDSSKWFRKPNPLTALFPNRKDRPVTEDELVEAVEQHPELKKWVEPFMSEQGFTEVLRHRVKLRLNFPPGIP